MANQIFETSNESGYFLYKKRVMSAIDERIAESANRVLGNYDIDEVRLTVAENLLKVSCGFHVSHTEEIILNSCQLLKKDRKPNKMGFIFLKQMFYASSNLRPLAYEAMTNYRSGRKHD